MKFKEIVVVEGLHDLERLKKIYGNDIDCLITNGSEIENNLPVIIEASKTRDIILFLDPDYPGERIRKRITSVIPNCKHAFIKKEVAISHNRRKVGVEHASEESIKNALDSCLTVVENTNKITMNDLMKLGLIGEDNSSALRDKICNYFNIGHTNGKTFLNRINMFGISLEQIDNVLNKP